jgi:hypothetical protein
MSLFLGKIHYWLYNKILWSEKAEKEVVQWAKVQGLPVERWVKQNVEQYGAPSGNKPLEEIIDTSNIHGWLQERIQSAELRQAALVTYILGENPGFMKALIEIFEKQGKAAALECDTVADSPEGMFDALHDFILEGMPCDRVNEVISSSDNEFVWQTTTCLHTPYWEQVAGDIRNFYTLRDAWVKAFIEALNPAFEYVKADDGRHIIARK